MAAPMVFQRRRVGDRSPPLLFSGSPSRTLEVVRLGLYASTVRVMEFQDVVLQRRMARDFSDEPVARPILDQLMANATRIPSAGYSQGFAFVVLTEPEQRRLFWQTTSGPEWRGESESVPLMDANRFAIGWPLILTGALNTSETNATTSGRPDASR